MTKISRWIAATLATIAMASPLVAEEITLQSTTSTQNSGLFEEILPKFYEETGIHVRVVAVGTGQAIKNAKNGDADVLLVHAKSAEKAFVADGYGVERFDLMYNDFIIVGPEADPAGVGGMRDVIAAMTRISDAGAMFASRGDESGTHKAEMRLWKMAGHDPIVASGTWYREMGQGMGATLNAGIGMGAYVLTDRATWIAFGNKQGHKILVEGDQHLFNQYGVILVNKEKHSHVKADAGQMFIDWLLSAEGQEMIAGYRMHGQQLFFPNAK
jgi:tungstate transport system substrate-binding protein